MCLSSINLTLRPLPFKVAPSSRPLFLVSRPDFPEDSGGNYTTCLEGGDLNSSLLSPAEFQVSTNSKQTS